MKWKLPLPQLMGEQAATNAEVVQKVFNLKNWEIQLKLGAFDLILTAQWHVFFAAVIVGVLLLLGGCTSTAQRQEFASNSPTKVLCHNLTYNLNQFSPETIRLMAAELNRRGATCDEDAGSTYTIKKK